MAFWDGHIHVTGGTDDRDEFRRRYEAAGVSGGVIISFPPPAADSVRKLTSAQRLDNLMFWCAAGPAWHPFYWIDPLEADAPGQIGEAVKRGVAGFKVICDRFYPYEDRPMQVFNRIAETRLPVLFHSGILWDGGRHSSLYNRPVNFECLFAIAGLRFALAHIGWPWCDELIAVYGKYVQAKKRPGNALAEMFIDLTPGTPPIWRAEALQKLFTVGYPVEDNVFFGSDNSTNGYDPAWVSEWRQRDNDIYKRLALSSATVAKIWAGNLRRFLAA